jgi:hypothetical protein
MKNNIPSFLIADMTYTNINTEGSVTLLFGKVDDATHPYSAFLIAQSPISPMQYPKETFEVVYDLFNRMDINFDEVSLYLDYKEFGHGSPKTHLTKWEVTHYNNSYTDDSLDNVTFEELSPQERNIRNRYSCQRT